jgi:metallo-beta-lactamase family protein
MHLVEAAGQRILLDCGLVRGPHPDARPGRDHFPFDPRGLDAVVLSHAHVDHCGNLPRLVHEGYSGPIFCTPATHDLLALILANSARIQEEDAFVHDVIRRAGLSGAEPFFTHDDVDLTLRQCVAVSYDEAREVAPGVRLRLVNAGHILGSAMVHLEANGNGRPVSLTFTGDLGRRRSFLLREPAPIPAANLLICESTYGGRTLEPICRAAKALETVVRGTVERGGKVLIPAFTLGRSQMVVYALRRAMKAGRLPEIPVYVAARRPPPSPRSTDGTRTAWTRKRAAGSGRETTCSAADRCGTSATRKRATRSTRCATRA